MYFYSTLISDMQMSEFTQPLYGLDSLMAAL